MPLHDPVVRWARRAARPVACAGGVLMMVLAPVAGLLPGPGGSVLFGVGLGIVLRTSPWARRRYARLMRRRPRLRRWMDWGMRRRSARRRRARDRQAGVGARSSSLTQGAGFRNRGSDPVARATGGLSTLNSKE